MIKNFFNKNILPLHQKVKTGEIKYLDDEFGTNEASYFSDPLHVQYHCLNTIDLQNESEFTLFLQKFWKDEPELLDLIPELAKLAFTLKGENNQQSSDLSPSLYVMF